MRRAARVRDLRASAPVLLCTLLLLLAPLVAAYPASDPGWAEALQRSFAGALAAARAREAGAATAPERLDALLMQAEVLAFYERPRELRALLSEAGPLLEGDPRTAPRLALALFTARADAIEGRHAQALKRLQALLADPAAGEQTALVFAARTERVRALAETGDYELAAHAGAELLQDAAALPDPAARARALLALAVAPYLGQEYGRALEYYREAETLFPPYARQEAAAARMGIAQMRNVLGEREAALAMLVEVTESYRRAGNVVREADARLLEGYCLNKLGRYEEALVAHRAALALREQVGSPVDLANSHTHLAGVLRRTGRHAESVAHARRAVELADAADDTSGQWDAYGTLAQSLAEQGEYREAYDYMRRAERTLLERSRFDLLERTAALRERYAAERRELENRALAAQLAAEQLAQRRLHAGIAAAGVLALALLVLALVLLSQVRRNRALARQDALTGLLNRRAVFADAQPELQRARRYGYALSVLLFDLDEFKRVNDELGHGAGDRVLRSVAEACRRLVRAGDLCGRIGGEEFLVVLPHTDAAEARALGERLRQAVALGVRAEDGRAVTVSVGVAQLGADPGDTLEDVVQRADAAMYLAKRGGRNRIEVGAAHAA